MDVVITLKKRNLFIPNVTTLTQRINRTALNTFSICFNVKRRHTSLILCICFSEHTAILLNKLIHCSYLGNEVYFRFLITGIRNEVQTIASYKCLIIVITFHKFHRNI